MDARPQRPSRAIRRQDENANLHAIHHKSANVATANAAGAGGQQKRMEQPHQQQQTAAGVGLKAAARRAAFGDVSNTVRGGIVGGTAKDNGKGGVIVLQEKQGQKTGAISKPAQRAQGVKIASSVAQQSSVVVASQHVRNVSRATAVYQDKRPSPRRVNSGVSSPKILRNLDVKESRHPGVRQGAQSRVQRGHNKQPLGSTRIEQHIQTRGEGPAYSSDRLQSDRYLDEEEDENDGASLDGDDEEYVTEDEEEELQADGKGNGVSIRENVISDSESGEDDGDETDFTYARSRAGDNTTGVTTQVLVPKVTTQSRRELHQLQSKFQYYDEEDEADISMVAEYGDEIFEYMRELERKMLPNASYMDHQSEIKWSMRAILMDWLVQVHCRFNLLPETLFLTSNYVDRFLSSKVVSLGKLQLVGATALFVAAKYEEINCPSVHEIVYMVDNGYTAEEILKAERFMLSMLQFELGWPGPMSFLRRISKADDYDLETRTLAKYFLEITVMDERFVGSPPSFLAAGAHCLARHMLQKGEWTPAHTFYSGYTASQLEPLVRTLVECCENPKSHHGAVYDKFADRRYKRASLFVENWMKSENSSEDTGSEA